MTTVLALDDESGKQLIADTLRLYVGQGKRISWEDLALATGDKPRTLRSYVEADPPTMPAPTLMRVFAVLPPEAWGRINRRMGFSSPGLADSEADVLCARQALTSTSRFVAEISEALEDGELNHLERASLARRAEQLIPTLHIIADGGT